MAIPLAALATRCCIGLRKAVKEDDPGAIGDLRLLPEIEGEWWQAVVLEARAPGLWPEL